MLLIVQRALSASQIRVNMEEFVSMTENTDAVARRIILGKPANVSLIALMCNYKVCVHNLLHPRSVSCSLIASLN